METSSTDYRLYAFIYVNSGNDGETIYKIILPIKARPKPIDYDDKEDDAFNATIAEVIRQVNEVKPDWIFTDGNSDGNIVITIGGM